MAKNVDLEFRVALRGLELGAEEADQIRRAVQKAALLELAGLDVASGYRVQRLTPELDERIRPPGQTDGIVAQLPELQL